MKVLYLIDTLSVGGAERSLLEIARHYRETKAALCHVYRGDTLRSEYEAAGIPVVSLDLDAKYGFVNAVRGVREVIRATRPDLVHTSLFRASIIGRIAGRLEGVPVVDSFVSDSYGEERRAGLSRMRRVKLAAVRAVDALTARWVAHFTANSNAAARSNVRALRLSASDVTVIHRGRDPRRFEPGTVAAAALPGRDGEPIGGPVFLSVGRLLESKGQDDLLHAFKTVHARQLEAHLLLAGEGPYRPELERLRRELGLEDCVHLLGQREDIPALLAAADVFVFPSHFEGHSGALVEAMLAQKPIVASDIPENRESVEHRVTALLVPPRHPEALAEAMVKLLEQPEEAKQLAAQAREVALERFDVRRIAEQHEELYRSVLEQRSR